MVMVRVFHIVLIFCPEDLLHIELVPMVLLSCDGYCFDVFTVSVNDAVCFCDSYCVGFVVMVAPTNHCTMSPWSTILSLNQCRRPY